MRADTVVIGSGWAGMLVAGELAAKGQRTVVLERGSNKSWAEQVKDRKWASGRPGSAPNHVVDSDGLDWPWTYVYGVGGTSNQWAGTSPRFLPEDFEMRSRFGLMRDWPISYQDLLPHYKAAEVEMGVAGPETDLMPGGGFPLPPTKLSPQDEAVAPHLKPFIALPQARPTKKYRDSPACCGSAQCQLCPVNSKASVLNRLRGVLESPNVDLRTETIAARLLSDPSGRRITGVETIGADGTRARIDAGRVVVAANGIESVGLLLRSGLDGGDTGHYLFDHRNSKLLVRTKVPVGVGHGTSLITGASYTYYTGDQRRRRASALLLPLNSGPYGTRMFEQMVDGLVEGRTGRHLRAEVQREWQRTLSFDVYLDDMPDRASRVRLAADKDAFGLPKNEIRYTRQTPYQDRAVAHLLRDVPRRLRALGARDATFRYAPTGAHHLGALRMGDARDGAVVDADLRHHRRENLFVVGGAVFPTYSPTHPTLTIGALSIRLGRMLAGERA